MDVQYNDKNMKEKLGSSVTQLLSDNLAYLPLKKRRPLLRSPPPPPPPPQTPLDGICAPLDSFSNPKPVASNSLLEVERSQGIELLAASACKNNDQEKLIPEKTITDASIKLVEVRKTPSTGNSLVKNNVTRTEDSVASQLIASVACKRGNSDVHNAKVGEKQEISVKKEQLLTPQETNACMDISSLKTSIDNADNVCNAEIAVKQEKLLKPQGIDACMNMPSSRKSTVKINHDKLLIAQGTNDHIPSLENPVLKVSTFGAENDTPDQVDSTTVSLNLIDKTDNGAEKGYGSGKYVRLHWDLNSMMDDWKLPADDQSIGSKGNSMENISSVISEKLDCGIGSDDSINNWRLFNCKSDISQVKHLDSGSSSERRINMSRENICISKIQLGQALSVKNIKLEKQDDALLDSGSVSNKNMHDMIRVKSEQEPIKLHKASSTVTDINNSSSKSEKVALPNVLKDKIVITPPVTTSAQCQPVPDYIQKENNLYSPTKVSPLGISFSGVEMKELLPKSYEQFDNPTRHPSSDVIKELISKPPKVANVVNHSLDIETKELMPKSREPSGDVTLEDHLDDGDVSDLSLGGHNHSIVKEIKNSTGYESPFEDGEVRERVMNSSEENECERECLDYDIEDRDDYDYGMEEGSQSIQNKDNIDFVEKATLESVVNSLNESSTSPSVENLPKQDQIAIAVESNNRKTDETVISGSGRLDAKGSFAKEMQSRAMRANFSSHVGESPASGTIDEKDTVSIQQRSSGSRSGPRFQAEQMFQGDKYLGKDIHFPQMQDERRKNNSNGSSSSFLDSRNDVQNQYQRSGNHIHPPSRSIIPDSRTDNYLDQRQSINYRPFVRKRPLDNSDKDFSPQRRNLELKDDGHGMIRGRSGNYHRGGFRGHISNVSAPSSPYMSARRRHSSSPILNRNPKFSRICRRSRSRSRSRTRSPIPWRIQEERNKGMGPRLERTRIHYQDPKYEENEDAFCSPPRKRFSQGYSGSFNDRNCGPSRFRSSPRRFDSRSSLERLKSDEGFRPRVFPQRFSKPPGNVWRGHNHEKNNYERTKYGYRNEVIRQGCDNIGANSRRFHNDEACFNGHNNRNNKGLEGRGSFKYDRERN